MPAVFEHPLIVPPEAMDELGHANNLAYMRWMIDAALAHSAAQGWPTARHIGLGSGWVVRSHAIKYLKPCVAGEQLVVKTWVGSGMKVTSVRQYRIMRAADRVLLARAETEWAYINFKTGMPIRIPPEVAESFVVVDDPEGNVS